MKPKITNQGIFLIIFTIISLFCIIFLLIYVDYIKQEKKMLNNKNVETIIDYPCIPSTITTVTEKNETYVLCLANVSER